MEQSAAECGEHHQSKDQSDQNDNKHSISYVTQTVFNCRRQDLEFVLPTPKVHDDLRQLADHPEQSGDQGHAHNKSQKIRNQLG